ncbi:hypothetical protein K3495_g10817 [Podosphaera aphanis]|nr:hypothetical protein K3495_g10817 [Podosphaera aphanis]
MSSSAEIGDYTVLNITIPPIASFPEKSTHTIYIRPHAPKISTENDSRSLFLVNVPIDSTSSHLRSMFMSLIGAGRFVSVSFEHENSIKHREKDSVSIVPHLKKRKRELDTSNQTSTHLPSIWDRDLRKSGSSAVVLLVDSRSVEKTIKVVKKLHQRHKSSKNTNSIWPIWGDGIPDSVFALGSTRYLTHQKLRFPNKDELKLDIDAFLTEFNTREEAQREQEKRAKNIPDSDGFITVSRGGRAAPATREAAEQKKSEMEEREKKKREEMQKSGFYRFQGREKKKEEAEDLLRRFEEDRKKVQALRDRKGKTGFRPEV